MKRLMLVMLAVAVLIVLVALVGVRADDVEPMSHQDAVLAQLAEGCDVYDFAPAPSPPESLAQLASPDLCATCTEEATAATMEQRVPHFYGYGLCAVALDSHVYPPYDLGRDLDAVKSAPVNVRDHAPL